MQEKPLVSVIIPVYNVEKYLRECIDSVLAQTYTNYEIILVDDGSTDSSGVICDEYVVNHNCITVIHQKNQGLSCSRNAGMEKAKGKYIYFLDSDDYISTDMLEKTVVIAQAENSDIVFFDAVAFADGKDFDISQSYHRIKEYSTCTGLEMLDELQKNGEYHSAVPLLLIKKEVMENQKVNFIPGIYHEDMAFTFQVFCLAQTVSQCQKALYYRRYRQDSIMTSAKKPKHFNGMSAVYYSTSDFSRGNGISENQEVKRYICRCAYNCFNIFEQLEREDKKKCVALLKKIKADIKKNNAYGDKALKMRCYGKLFWVAYKIYEKTVGKLLRG